MQAYFWAILMLLVLNGLNFCLILYLIFRQQTYKIIEHSTEKPLGKMVQTPQGLFELQSSKPGVYDNSDEALWQRERERSS